MKVIKLDFNLTFQGQCAPNMLKGDDLTEVFISTTLKEAIRKSASVKGIENYFVILFIILAEFSSLRKFISFSH